MNIHFSSTRSLLLCVKRHVLQNAGLSHRDDLAVLDVGSSDANGSVKRIFQTLGASYTGAHLTEGPHVGVVMPDPARLPFENARFDIVYSAQTFAHAPEFWVLFEEMVRVCHPEGVVLLIAPSAGAAPRYLVDCYRFLPDSFSVLANRCDMDLVDSWRDPCGPFHDVVGVFRHRNAKPVQSCELPMDRWLSVAAPAQNDPPAVEDPSVEVRAGQQLALSFLEHIHSVLEPSAYVEVGVHQGHSLRLARCPAVGIDPYPVISEPAADHHRILAVTSDEFFYRAPVGPTLGSFDFAYIDGMHLIENVLMDFMNIEKHASVSTVVAIDDVFPNHAVQASRRRVSRHWTGDVWKVMHILRAQRPDLLLMPIDTEPTGTLLVFGLDPTNTTLWEVFDHLLHSESGDLDPPALVLERHDAFSPTDRLVTAVLKAMKHHRDGLTQMDEVLQMVRQALPRQIASQI
jgi:hypothetical protein